MSKLFMILGTATRSPEKHREMNCAEFWYKKKKRKGRACLAIWSHNPLPLLPQSSTAQENPWPWAQLFWCPLISYTLPPPNCPEFPKGPHPNYSHRPCQDPILLYTISNPSLKSNCPLPSSPGLALSCLSLKSIWGTKELASKPISVMVWHHCSQGNVPKGNYKLKRAAKVENPNGGIPEGRVVRTFLGKDKRLRKECTLFPWNSTK